MNIYVKLEDVVAIEVVDQFLTLLRTSEGHTQGLRSDFLWVESLPELVQLALKVGNPPPPRSLSLLNTLVHTN